MISGVLGRGSVPGAVHRWALVPELPWATVLVTRVLGCRGAAERPRAGDRPHATARRDRPHATARRRPPAGDRARATMPTGDDADGRPCWLQRCAVRESLRATARERPCVSDRVPATFAPATAVPSTAREALARGPVRAGDYAPAVRWRRSWENTRPIKRRTGNPRTAPRGTASGGWRPSRCTHHPWLNPAPVMRVA